MKRPANDSPHFYDHNKRAMVEWNPEQDKQQDDVVIHSIQALNFFIAQAAHQQLGTLARILDNAKEEIVYWAVDMDFHETQAEKFINMLLYTNSFMGAGGVMGQWPAVSAGNRCERCEGNIT